MLRDGRYAAWYRTSQGEGTGIVQLANGLISGGDGFFSYSGTYQLDGDRFTAVLTTRKHANGPSTVLGIDEVELKLSGRCNGTMASCSGTAEQAPGVVFEATLFLGQDPSPDPSPEPDRKCATLNFDASKLPRGAGGRNPPRDPFGRGPSGQR